MHQYKIICTAYSEKGALTNNKTVFYADNAEQAQQKYEQYKNMYYVNEDGSRGMKMYKVEVAVVAYKYIENPDAFFKQFEI